jgi:hypothetical protein
VEANKGQLKKEIAMKKTNLHVAVCLSAVIALFLMASATVKVQADPAPNSNVSQFCTENNDFGHTHGECVSIWEANANAFAGKGIAEAVALCKILEEVFGPFPLGQCISHFASY